MDFSKYLNSMYMLAAVLLLLVAASVSYARRVFPTNLVVAITVAVIADSLLKKFYLKKELKFPYSAIISGTIIGSIAPFNTSVVVIIIAALAAMISKFFIRLKGKHVFNPATFGLLVSLLIFGFGDEWWAATSFPFAGIALTLTPLLIIANWKADKLPVAIPFLLLTVMLNHFSGTFPFSLENAYNFFISLPFYFAFIMVSEPKTSPFEKKEQIVFGIFVAALTFVLGFYGVRYYFLLALLTGNFLYSIYRNYFSPEARSTGQQLSQ